VTINPALDVWVWVASALLLAVLGARAWVVETGQARLGRTPVKVRVMTGAVVVVLVALFGLLAMQGGILLVDSLLSGTDPAAVYYGPDGEPGGGDDAGDPAAGRPPAGGAQPPAAPGG
jgi:hypothetical protein